MTTWIEDQDEPLTPAEEAAARRQTKLAAFLEWLEFITLYGAVIAALAMWACAAVVAFYGWVTR